MKNSVIVPISVSAFSSGYNLSAKGGTASYKWNGAGLLNADSARGIRKTYYNESGQPTSIEFTDKGHLDYTYSTSGELIRVSTYAMLPGGRRPTLVSERCYCGGFVFEGDSLIYANFPGGYFDGEGLPHYSHTDFQGNITMVTDRDGQICQHTGYYPYGEPWREPAGQPYLYGGKERMRDGSLNDYDFSARRLNSALALWTAPDPMARDFSSINPYVYCASNPIRYVDPTGCEYVFNNITAEDKETIIRILSTGTSGALSFSFDKNVLKAKIIDENAKLSDAEKVIFDYLTREEETSITIENNSTTVLIGEADTAKMDLKDITNLGSQGSANDIGAFMHELIEQYYLQKHKANKEKMGEKKYNEIKGSAHIKATRQEAIINGVLIDKDRIIHSTYILFKYNPDKNLPWTKETHYPKYIKIPIKGKNVIKRK